MLNKIIKCFVVILFFSCISCEKDILTKEDSLKILIPVNNWTYNSNVEISFSCNILESNLIWKSSLQGEIGRDNNFIRTLTPGVHIISVIDVYDNTDSVTINVLEQELTSDDVYLITDFPYYLKNEGKIKKAGIISLDGVAENIQVGGNFDNTFINENYLQIKDFSIENDLMNLKPLLKKSSRGAMFLNDTKSFYVMNTTTGNSSHEIKANNVYTGKYISVWLCEDANFMLDCLDEIIDKLENVIFPRVKQLWGDCADINKDGTCSILFSSTINQEKTAVGFFNTGDFFSNDKDIQSKSYNPYSNELDIIYVAVPEKDNKNYSIDSIIATIAHEYTHAITFTNKTWKSLQSGQNIFLREEIFLDEGWSHLSETLVGYGVSGGNNDFIEYYLNNMSYYSFCKNDYLGRNDSVGQRGAICLFLYWLFNKAGGIEYDDNKIDYIDKGGIKFLRSMITSDITGWDCIGEFFEKSTDSLFLEFSKEIMNTEKSFVFSLNKKDPLTNELFLPEINCNTINYNINKILPYSITPFIIDINEDFYVDGTNLKGTMFLYLRKI